MADENPQGARRSKRMRQEMPSSLRDNTAEKFPAAGRGRVPGCEHSVTDKLESCGCCRDYCDAVDAIADAAPAMQLPPVASTTASSDRDAVQHAMRQEMQSGLPPAKAPRVLRPVMRQEMQSGLPPAKAPRVLRPVPTPARGSRSSQAAAQQRAHTIVSARQPETAEKIDDVSKHPQAEEDEDENSARQPETAKKIDDVPEHPRAEEDEDENSEEDEDFYDYPLDPMDDVPKFEGDMHMMTLGIQTPSLLRRFRRYEAFMNQPTASRYGYVLTCGHGRNEHVKACRVCHDHIAASAWLADLYGRSRRAAQSQGIAEPLERRS